MKYDFKIVFRALVKHQAAETLSRLATTGIDNSELQDEFRIMLETVTENYDQKESSVPNQVQKN